MVTLDTDDIGGIELDDLPSIEVQMAVIEEIERLMAEGKSEHLAVSLVFDYNLFQGKLH